MNTENASVTQLQIVDVLKKAFDWTSAGVTPVDQIIDCSYLASDIFLSCCRTNVHMAFQLID